MRTYRHTDTQERERQTYKRTDMQPDRRNLTERQIHRQQNEQANDKRTHTLYRETSRQTKINVQTDALVEDELNRKLTFFEGPPP